MNIIVAADKNWGIGRNNELLVSIPADMKMFREETSGKVVVMGRKTLESFPNGLPLKNRTNIVLTGNKDYKVKDAVIVHTIEELLEEIKSLLRVKVGITKHFFNSWSFYYISTIICSCNSVRQVTVALVLDLKFLLENNRCGIYCL